MAYSDGAASCGASPKLGDIPKPSPVDAGVPFGVEESGGAVGTLTAGADGEVAGVEGACPRAVPMPASNAIIELMNPILMGNPCVQNEPVFAISGMRGYFILYGPCGC